MGCPMRDVVKVGAFVVGLFAVGFVLARWLG